MTSLGKEFQANTPSVKSTMMKSSKQKKTLTGKSVVFVKKQDLLIDDGDKTPVMDLEVTVEQ
jgi:hypothetical protein